MALRAMNAQRRVLRLRGNEHLGKSVVRIEKEIDELRAQPDNEWIVALLEEHKRQLQNAIKRYSEFYEEFYELEKNYAKLTRLD